MYLWSSTFTSLGIFRHILSIYNDWKESRPIQIEITKSKNNQIVLMENFNMRYTLLILKIYVSGFLQGYVWGRLVTIHCFVIYIVFIQILLMQEITIVYQIYTCYMMFKIEIL